MLTAVCGGTASVPTNVVRATTTVDNSLLHATSVEASAAVNGTPITHHLPKNDFLIAGVAQDIVSTGHLQGTATYSTPTGTLTTLTCGAEQGAFANGSTGCWFGGTAETETNG